MTQEQIKWKRDKVDPEQVRLALQEVQLNGAPLLDKRVTVDRVLIAAARYAIEKLQAAHARYAGGDRKCSECGDDRKGLTLCCMNCLNNDGWSHSEHPVVGYAGGGEAVGKVYRDGMDSHVGLMDTDLPHGTILYTHPAPAPEVPDKKPEPEHLPDWDPRNHYVKGWNECRQAMIVASKENK